MVIPKLPLPVRPLESVTLTVNEEEPGAVGVPLTAPEVERTSPSGNAEPVKL
jgi:hypothetical protein